MITRPTDVDDAIKFVWKQPDTNLTSSEKQSLNAILAHKTDLVAARYFSAPQPEDWVDTLKTLLEPTVAHISKKRRLSSIYADRRKKLPSASRMNLTIMQQQQGVTTYDDRTQQPCLLDVDSPLYLNYRCSAHQVPIKLLHPIFGKFERLAETVQPTVASLNFVQTVCAQARYYYASKEKDYQLVMQNVWRGLLSQFGAAPHGLPLIAGFKIGLDDMAQPVALRYYEQLWEEMWPQVLNQSFAATFVIEMMGAGLRIGGAAWGDRIHYEPLTPVMNLLLLLGQESAVLRLAQQVTALLTCLKELMAEYSIRASPPQNERAELFRDSVPIALHDTHRFMNVSRFDAEHPGLYMYTDPESGQTRLAKFAGRYGTDVHAAWASAGLAPILFGVMEIGYHTFLITTELLPATWRVLSNLSDSELLDSKPYVLQALQQAQSVEIHAGSRGVHGDVRLPNVAVLREGQQWHVRFLDFEWAGVSGEHTYPPFMNSKITWPPGVHPYAGMVAEHDAALMQTQFDLALH